ncbi:hypothetical protein DL96DRAFT_1604547 [Flagelloscypha sp. PMI_526]|nr:hypothetical protein DL96DRAFT_1604547 [Flagelloscypha sp. PMI_526]
MSQYTNPSGSSSLTQNLPPKSSRARKRKLSSPTTSKLERYIHRIGRTLFENQALLNCFFKTLNKPFIYPLSTPIDMVPSDLLLASSSPSPSMQPIDTQSLSNQVREMPEQAIMSECKGKSSQPIIFSCFQTTFKSGCPWSNAFLLCNSDRPEELAKHQWQPFNEDNTMSFLVDTSPAIATISREDEGQSLHLCDTAWELCECIFHALICWATTFKYGELRHDPTIVNIRKLKNPCVKENPSRKDTKNKSKSRQTPFDISVALRNLGGIFTCISTLKDFDLTSKHYNKPWERGQTLPGTEPFVSRNMWRFIDLGLPYVQSPLDDLWAFFYAMAWGTLFNHRIQSELSTQERAWQRQIRGTRSERDGVVTRMCRKSLKWPAILQSMSLVLREWRSRLRYWTRVFQLLEAHVGLQNYEFVAHQGAVDLMEIMSKYEGTLKTSDELRTLKRF